MRALKCCLLVLFCGLASACVSVGERSGLARWEASGNFNQRQAQLIILHHTHTATFEQALRMLKTANAQGRVSAHYLIAADGRIVQLVAENQRAWHAGLGRFNGLDDLNSRSIGIELVNDGASPFAEAQIASLLRLLGDICVRRKMDPRQVIAHGDVAPTRKADPSRYFPWARLAQAGFGLWPRAACVGADCVQPDAVDPWLALRLIGYDLRDREAAVRAWRRHFRGDDGSTLDAQDLVLLADLVDQLVD